MAASLLAVAGSWSVVAVVGLVVLLLGFVVVMVRSAKTNMVVRIGKIIEIRRGNADSPATQPEPNNSAAATSPPDEAAHLC